MDFKNAHRWLLIVAAPLVVAIVVTFSFWPKHYPVNQISASDQPIPTSTTNRPVVSPPQIVRAGLPIRLKIPKISVDATVEQVGLTAKGAMGAPSTLSVTAWYDLGPRPGEVGSAVIDGHFGWKHGVAAVFNNIHKLHSGDELLVMDDAGVTTTFIVRELRDVEQHTDATDIFISNDGQAHLNLITCEGIWNKRSQSYSRRLIVFADKK